MTAVAADGAGAAGIYQDKAGLTWTRRSTLIVPAGAQQLCLLSSPDGANPDLAGVQITLASPDGSRRIVLGNGAVTCTGFAEQNLDDPALDAALQDYFASLRALLPTPFTPDDIDDLAARFNPADPAGPVPVLSDAVIAQLQAYHDRLAGLSNTIHAAAGARQPSAGMTVYGPQPGTWTVTVNVTPTADSFCLMALALPGDLTLDAVDNAARALGVQSHSAGVRTAQGVGGSDPGCDKAVDAWRHPPEGSPDAWRAAALRAVWFVIQTALEAGVALVIVDELAALVPEAVAVAIVAHGLTVKGVVAFAVGLIVESWTDFHNKAEDSFWHYAWCVSAEWRWRTIAYLAISKRQPPFASRLYRDGETVEVTRGAQYSFQVTALNADHFVVEPEQWTSDAKWGLAPASFLSGPLHVDETRLLDTYFDVAADATGTASLRVSFDDQPTAPTHIVLSVNALSFSLVPADKRIARFSRQGITIAVAGDPGPGSNLSFDWTATSNAGTLTDSGGHPAPFTTTHDLRATFTSTNKTGTDTISVTVKNTPTGGLAQIVGNASTTVTVFRGPTVTPALVLWGPVYWSTAHDSHYQAGVTVLGVWEGERVTQRGLWHTPGYWLDGVLNTIYASELYDKGTLESKYGGHNIWGLQDGQVAMAFPSPGSWREVGVESSPPMGEEQSKAEFDAHYANWHDLANSSDTQQSMGDSVELVDLDRAAR